MVTTDVEMKSVDSPSAAEAETAEPKKDVDLQSIEGKFYNLYEWNITIWAYVNEPKHTEHITSMFLQHHT